MTVCPKLLQVNELFGINGLVSISLIITAYLASSGHLSSDMIWPVPEPHLGPFDDVWPGKKKMPCDEFPAAAHLVCDEDQQLTAEALEAARIAVNKHLAVTWSTRPVGGNGLLSMVA